MKPSRSTFWSHYKRASTIYDIHSPFLFELLSFIEDDTRVYYDFEQITEIHRSENMILPLTDVFWFYRLSVYFRDVYFDTSAYPELTSIHDIAHDDGQKNENSRYGLVTTEKIEGIDDHIEILLIISDFNDRYLKEDYLPLYNFRLCYPGKQLLINSSKNQAFTAHAYAPYYMKPWRAGFF